MRTPRIALWLLAAAVTAAAILYLARPGPVPPAAPAFPAEALRAAITDRLPKTGSPDLDNLAAYIPAQCYAVTRDEQGVHNSCFTCHQESRAPNYVDDADVQTSMSLPRFALANHWTHLAEPPPPATITDEDLLAHVRRSNYLDASGRIKLAGTDCFFHPDASGFDRAPDGSATGWRAYAYAPLPGMFWPTNGSAGDAFVRLPPEYRRDASGREDLAIYEVNLAIVEAYLRRADVPIASADEKKLGSDLDGDGKLGTAEKVAFVWPPVAGRGPGYVGQAASLDRAVAGFPAAGLFPTGAEILHSVRYLDVRDGKVGMAERMKELRHMRKVRWRTYSELDIAAKAEMFEKMKNPDELKLVLANAETGVGTGTGWRMKAFIEDAAGELRPQTVEETTACIGCHGGVGITSDSTFSFARKIPGAAGWYHWKDRGLAGIPEPRRADGRGEYALYLAEVGGGDDFRANEEVRERFFDAGGKPKADMLQALAKDIAVLVVPSPQRALALDRAYLGLVRAQAFAKGRDVVLGAPQFRKTVAQDEETGIDTPVEPAWKAAPGVARR